MTRSRREPRVEVIDGVEYVLLEPEEYAVQESHRRQVGGLQASLARARAQVAELRQDLEEARTQLDRYRTSGRERD
jgi:multidrug resistance efflux pump